jgi:hypothetical protein
MDRRSKFVITGLLIMVVMFFAKPLAKAQLVTEDFSYTASTTMVSNGYTALGVASPVQTIAASGTGLSYAGSPRSNVGLALPMASSGEDVYKAFTSQTSGAVYASALINLSAVQATGDYFFMLMTGTGFTVRLFARTNGAGFSLGIGKSTAAAVYDANLLALNTTHLVVIKYQFNAAASDDAVSLFINPTLGAAEPAANVSSVGAPTADAASINGYGFRQGSAANAPTLVIDGVMVGTTWAQVTPSSGATPSLTSTPATLSGFNYTAGSGPSSGQSFSLSGSNLTGAPGNITITGSTNYEVSTDNVTYAASRTVAYSSATLAATNVFIRLKAGLSAGTYNSETISITGGGATSSVTASGSVTAATPALTPTPATLTGFSYIVGAGPSTSQSFSLSGINLTGAPGNITITGSTNFEVSTDNTTFAASRTVAYTSGTLAATTLYVRLKAGAAAGSYSGQTISISGGGASTSITASGSVAAPFTAGNIVVLRSGTGVAALGNTGTPVFADEYTTAGVLTTTLPFPTTTSGSTNRATIVGNSTAEGGLNLSSNGQYLIISGYDAAEGQASPNANTNNRVISRMDRNGTVSSSLFAGTIHPSNFRSASSDDGSRYWTAGNNGGIQFMAHQGSTTPGTPTAISSTPSANQRFVAVFNNQVYHTSQTALARTNVALPTGSTSSTTIATLTDGYGFYFVNRGGINWNLYVANGTGNNVLKFSSADDGVTWTARGNISVGAAVYGLVAQENAGSVDVYVSSPAALFKCTDAAAFNASMSGTFASIATAPANTAFRGLAFSPNASGLLTSTGTLINFGYSGAGPSASQSFNISGSGLSTNIVVTAPTNYEVSKDDITFSSSVSYAPSGGTVSSSPVYVRLKAGLGTGTYNESVTVSSTGASSKTVNVFGGVQPTVTISVSAASGSETAGTAITVTATCSPAVSGDQTLDLAVTGTGITTGDYTLTDGDGTLAGIQIKILSGATSGTSTFTIQNDGLNEGSETATITASNATSGMILIAPFSQNVSITDDDAELVLPGIGTPSTTIDFNDLVATGTSSEISQGGYLLETNGTGSSANSSYNTGTGSSSAGDSYSFGIAGTNPVTDRAFGSLVTGSLSDVKQGFKIKNTTGTAVNAVIVDYWGEQWRRGQTGSTGAQFRDKLLFQYSTNATDLSTGTWASSSRLNFNSPDFANSALDQPRDGNLSFYRTHVVDTFFLASSVANNANLWVRWQHSTTGTSGSRDGLAIDDVNFTAINYTPKIFYSAPSGDLNDLATWWTEPDSSGINPTSFSGSNQTFIIQGRSAATISANWVVSGSNSVVRLRSGVNFTVPAAFSFTGVVDSVANGATLTLLNATVPTLNGIEANSTVIYGSASAQNVAIPTSTNNQYGNLTFSGAGTKTIQGGFRVEGNLVMDNTDMSSGTTFSVVFFGKNITATGTVTFSSNFGTYVNLQAVGSLNQVINGGGNTIIAGRLIMNVNNSGGTLITSPGSTLKTGSLSLAAGTGLTLGDDLKLNSNSGGATFADNGNTITIGGDFECAGASTDYNFTGTVVLNSATGANIRQDGSGGSGSSAKAELNNLSIETSGTAAVTVQPASFAAILTIKGNLSLGGTSTGKLNLGQNVIKIGGDYTNTRDADLIAPGTSTIEFNGSGVQTFNSAYTGGGEAFGSLSLANSGGLSMASGDIRINGTLSCVVGVLNTGSGKIIMSNASTITETSTAFVLGQVETSRTLTNALNNFGGLGIEVTALGNQPGLTGLLRTTGQNVVTGCGGISLKRIYALTPTNNAGLNATVVFNYNPTVAEINSLNLTYVNLLTGGGPWVSASNLAVHDIPNSKITATGLGSIGTFIAAYPEPTLSSLDLGPRFCSGNTANITLNGLLANSTFTVFYSVDGVAQPSVAGVTSNASGVATFSTAPLTAASNGKEVLITALRLAPVNCLANFTSNNFDTLEIDPLPTVSISANDFVCQGQNAPVEFFFTGSANWTMNYKIDGVAQPALINQAVSPFQTAYNAATVARTYSVTSLSDAYCTADAAGLDTFTIEVPNPCSITWNGSVDSDWNNANNWTPNNAAPSNKTSVVIPGNTPNIPLVNSASPAPICASLSLSGGGSASVGSGFQLNVRGDIIGGINSSPVGGSGKLVLSGTGQQNITGNVRLTNVEFANTSGAGVVIPSGSTLNIEPDGEASFIANSKLTVTGDMILRSSASGTAKIGVIPTTASITGQLTMERWLPYTSSNGGGWYLMGSPFSGSDFTGLADDFKVSGLATGFGSQGGSILPVNQPERNTVFKYSEILNNTRLDTVQKDGWLAPAAENMAPGLGYRVFVDYYSNSTHKFDTKGLLVRNDFTFPALTRSPNSICSPATYACDLNLNGWNLLSNPYPCAIDWDAAAGWTKPSAMNNAFYTWNSAAAGYRAYIGAGGVDLGVTVNTGANANIIPSSQAFFVRLTSGNTANLIVKEAAKVTNTSGTYFRTASSESSSIRMRLKKNDQSAYHFDAMVKFEEGSSDNFDQNRDLDLLSGPSYEFGFPSSTGNMLLNSQAALMEETRIIPMAMNLKGNRGNFSFEVLAQQIPAGAVAFIRDQYLNTITEISQGSVISFEAMDDAASMADRFELIINPAIYTGVSGLNGAQMVSIYPNPTESAKGARISLKGFKTGSARILVSDVMGRMVRETGISLTNANQEESMEINGLAPGVYTVNVQAEGKTLVRKLVIR